MNIAQLFLDLLAATEFEQRLPAGFGGRHALSDIVLDELVDVEAKLGIELSIERAIAEQIAEARPDGREARIPDEVVKRRLKSIETPALGGVSYAVR